MITLKQMLEQHPEWADLPIAVYRSSGDLDYIDCSGSAYVGEDWPDDAADVTEGTGDPVLIFSGN